MTKEEMVEFVKLRGPRYVSQLTVREHFAAMAMQGLLSNSIPGSHRNYDGCGIEAVVYADALIAALNTEDLTKDGE